MGYRMDCFGYTPELTSPADCPFGALDVQAYYFKRLQPPGYVCPRYFCPKCEARIKQDEAELARMKFKLVPDAT